MTLLSPARISAESWHSSLSMFQANAEMRARPEMARERPRSCRSSFDTHLHLGFEERAIVWLKYCWRKYIMSLHKPFTWLTLLIVQGADPDTRHQVKNEFLQFLFLICLWFLVTYRSDRPVLSDNITSCLESGWYKLQCKVGNRSPGLGPGYSLDLWLRFLAEQPKAMPWNDVICCNMCSLAWGILCGSFGISVGNLEKALRGHQNVSLCRKPPGSGIGHPSRCLSHTRPLAHHKFAAESPCHSRDASLPQTKWWCCLCVRTVILFCNLLLKERLFLWRY